MNSSNIFSFNISGLPEQSTSSVNSAQSTESDEHSTPFDSVLQQENENTSAHSEHPVKEVSSEASNNKSEAQDNENVAQSLNPEAEDPISNSNEQNTTLITETNDKTGTRILIDLPNSEAIEAIENKVTLTKESSPFAGSLATQSDNVIESKQQAEITMVSEVKSDQPLPSGNIIPPSGKNLPGNLHFLSEQNDSPVTANIVLDTGMSTDTKIVNTVQKGLMNKKSSRISTLEVSSKNTRLPMDLDKTPEIAKEKGPLNSMLTTNNGKTPPGSQSFIASQNESPLQNNTMSEFVNKAINHNQQFLNLNSSQPALANTSQQSNPVDTLTALNTNALSNIDKLIKGSELSTLEVENNNNFTIKSPAGSPAWNNQLSNRIRWMGNLKISSAELKLHPAELGTVEIKIVTEDDQTKVSFLTNNNVTKEIIEASLPKLRDLLADSGLQLGQSDVSQRNLSQDEAQQDGKNASSINDEATTGMEINPALVQQQRINPYDHYV